MRTLDEAIEAIEDPEGLGCDELAKQLAACKHFSWMPGMRNSRGFLRANTGWLFADDNWCESDAYPPHIPDRSDPATLGCLLHLAREAWGDPLACVISSPRNSGGLWRCVTHGARSHAHSGATEFELLANTIIAAP